MDLFEGDKKLNSVTTLKVPMKSTSGNIRYRDGFMVNLLTSCCAEDYEGTEATLEVIMYFEGMEPISRKVNVVIEEVEWPL